jgi:imidazolonepropionase-like amidohydrolase
MRILFVVAAAGFAIALGCREARPVPAPVPPAPAAMTAAAGSVVPHARVPPIPLLARAPPPMKDDRVAFTLFKFLGETGAERDTYVALPDGGTEAKALFSYRDRMQTVPLAAVFDFAADGSLRRYSAWGKTSRFTTIDDVVVARDDGTIDVSREGGPVARVAPSDGAAGVASGYAPMLAQDLLLRAWNQHGRPARMALLPEGEVAIESRGKETYAGPSGPVVFEHVTVQGLVWGREDAWLDEAGTLAAVVTRDAEFDHSEAVREGYGAILPKLARATGTDGVAWLAQAARGAERSHPGAIAFVGGTLIDGTGRAPVLDAVVVVDGDRIVAAGPRASIAVPAGAQTIDVGGRWILPGLWDMHAHVEQIEQLAVYLAAGVTTVRDMGNVLDFITGVRDAVDAGTGLGPRVFVNGLIDGEGPGALGTVHVRSAQEIAPTIDRLKAAGCIEVKIYSSVPPSLVKPIVAYAHAHGMRAVGHVPDGMTTQAAIDAGYDSISHIDFLLDPVLPREEVRKLSRADAYRRIAGIDLSSAPMEKEIASLVARHVVVDDTLSLLEQLFHTREENARREPGIATLPRELEATLGGIPASLAADADAAYGKYVELLRELHRRGVPVVAGSDINVPGHSVHREIELYVTAGMSPLEAIQAATLVPARVMHMDRDLGSVEPGKRADLVIVSGDPLADVRNVRRTFLVVTRGRAYEPQALWRLVGFRPDSKD